MVRFGVAGIIARRRAASAMGRWAAEEAERYPTETWIERGAVRLWRVTAPTTLRRAGSFAPNEPVELQPGTSLRYEYLDSGRDYWGGYTVYTTRRRFLVQDGEHAGARVIHTETRWCGDGDGDDASDWSDDPFPPAALEAAEQRPTSEPGRGAQEHP
jgi:hypothetical protein